MAQPRLSGTVSFAVVPASSPITTALAGSTLHALPSPGRNTSNVSAFPAEAGGKYPTESVAVVTPSPPPSMTAHNVARPGACGSSKTLATSVEDGEDAAVTFTACGFKSHFAPRKAMKRPPYIL